MARRRDQAAESISREPYGTPGVHFSGNLNVRLIMLSTILIVLLILILIGALPRWGYSGNWGYGPGGLVGVILIIVIVLALAGRI